MFVINFHKIPIYIFGHIWVVPKDKLAWYKGSLHLRPWSTGRQVWEGRRRVMVGGWGVQREYVVCVVWCSVLELGTGGPPLLSGSSWRLLNELFRCLDILERLSSRLLDCCTFEVFSLDDGRKA